MTSTTNAEALPGRDPRGLAGLRGAKVALFHQGQVLVLQRDARPDILWPGAWDLPGGGVEPGETASACVLRETFEEVGLVLAPSRLETAQVFPSMDQPGAFSAFFSGRITPPEIARLRLGDEGQCLRMMAAREYLARADAVPALQQRLRGVVQRYAAL